MEISYPLYLSQDSLFFNPRNKKYVQNWIVLQVGLSQSSCNFDKAGSTCQVGDDGGGVGLILGQNDFVIFVVLNVTSRFEKLKIITTLLQPGQKCVVLIDRQDLIACDNITRISIQRQRKMTHLFI